MNVILNYFHDDEINNDFFLKQLRSEPSPEKDIGAQLTLVSATMPTSLADILDEIIDVSDLFPILFLSE